MLQLARSLASNQGARKDGPPSKHLPNMASCSPPRGAMPLLERVLPPAPALSLAPRDEHVTLPVAAGTCAKRPTAAVFVGGLEALIIARVFSLLCADQDVRTAQATAIWMNREELMRARAGLLSPIAPHLSGLLAIPAPSEHPLTRRQLCSFKGRTWR